MNEKRINILFASIAFLFGLVLYAMTMAPTVSFWDCGEFIACSYRLAVPHPPGSPLYLLVGRFFTLIPEFLIDNVAKRVNLISVLSSAFTVLFLYLSIVHLIREYLKSNEGYTRYLPYLGALVGSLTFAVTPSFWFNAVEAEVYAPSALFTSLSVWLILHWSERSEEIGNEKYILLIAYLTGLAIGVHLLNVLTLPMVFMIIYYRRFELNPTTFTGLVIVGGLLTALVYPGMVIGIPLIAEKIGFLGLLFSIILLIAVLAVAVSNRQHLIGLLVMSILLIVVGYSSYMMIYIRSNLNPNIDENNPETIEQFISYVNREQYGEHHLDRERAWKESPNGRNYASASEFFWSYQVNYMYNRYFLWNFTGMAENGVDSRMAELRTLFSRDFSWTLKLLFSLTPLLLGLWGAYAHFRRDWKHALAVLALFLMTGYAIILYLNQPDPQPRERDYSYVGSFFAFSIWIGIGAAALLEQIAGVFKNSDRGFKNILVGGVTIIMLILLPFRILAEDYHMQDRNGNYVAWDYSYNMLVSSEQNGIMFTNGDNDTFPLWYLQEVEYIRTDVRVANLSLLNTPWYIQQLKDKEPKAPISLSDDQISRMIYPQPWETRKFELPIVPEPVRRAEADRYKLSLNVDTVNAPATMSFEVRPKLNMPMRGGGTIGGLRVQDLMILNILATNQFQKPLYFAVTTSDQNRLDGLKDYQRMDGLLFKVTTIPGWSIDPDVLYDNLMNKFQYRNLNNPDVYYNENIIGLLQNYRSAFFRLATHYLSTEEQGRFNEVLQKLYAVMPPEVIPFTNAQFEEVMTTFAIMADIYPADSLNARNYNLRVLQASGEVGLSYKRYDMAEKGYRGLLQSIESQPESEQVQDYLRSFFRSPQEYSQATAERKKQILESAAEQIRRQLTRVYKESKQYEQGTTFLQEWLQIKPNNAYAQKQLEEFDKLKAEE